MLNLINETLYPEMISLMHSKFDLYMFKKKKNNSLYKNKICMV